MSSMTPVAVQWRRVEHPLPLGAPDRVWMVIRPTGEHYFMYKPPLEGWDVWAKGFDGKVIEYTFGSMTHVPSPKKRVPK